MLFYVCYDIVKRVEVVMFTFCQFCSMRHLANGDVVIETRSWNFAGTCALEARDRLRFLMAELIFLKN